VSDIPGEFLHADMSNDNLHILLKDTIAEMITKLDPEIYKENTYGTTNEEILCYMYN